MTDLSPIVEAAGANTLPYIDPAFPDRQLVLHSARPHDYDPETPVLFVHHGVGRNGAAYRDYWLRHVDDGRYPGDRDRISGSIVSGLSLVSFRQSAR